MPSAAEDVSGRLLLAASYTVIGYFLPYHLQRLSQQYPQLDIQLHELNRSAIEEGLIANRYDMAVLLTSNVANRTWRSSISSVRPGGYGCRPGILAGARYRHAGRRGARAFIMLTVDEAAYTALRYWNETPFAGRAAAHLVGRGRAQHGGQRQRRGGAVGHGLPALVAGRAAHRDDPAQDPIPPMNVGLAWRKGAEISPAMRAVREYFRHAYTAQRVGQA